MFRVASQYRYEDDPFEKDDEIREAAGISSCDSGVGFGDGFQVRDRGWRVATLAEAIALKNRIEAIPGVTAVIREEITADGGLEG